MTREALGPAGDKEAPQNHEVATDHSRTLRLSRSLSKPRDTPATVPWCPGLCHCHSQCSKASWACNSIRMGKMHMLPSAPWEHKGQRGQQTSTGKRWLRAHSLDFVPLKVCYRVVNSKKTSQPLAFQLTLVLLNSWEQQSDAQELCSEGWSLFMKDLWVTKGTKK